MDEPTLARLRTRIHEIMEHGRFLHHLNEDLAAAREMVRKAPPAIVARVLFNTSPTAELPAAAHFARRTLVRTAFALIEGYTSSMLDAAGEHAARHGTAFFTESEVALLRRRTETGELALKALVIDVSRGKVKPRDGGFVRTKDAIQLAFDLYARGLPTPWLPQFDGGTGWDALCEAIAIRDGLMHPKRMADMDVADTALEKVNRGVEWFIEAYETLHEEWQVVLELEAREALLAER